MLLTIAGLIRGVYAIGTSGLTLNSFLLSSVWALFNLLLLAASIEVARERPQTRSSYRLSRRIPCEGLLNVLIAEGETIDLSEEGALVQLNSHHAVPDTVFLRFRGQVEDDEAYECSVIRTVWVKGKGDKLALRFNGLTEHVRRKIILQMFSAPDTWDKVRRPLTDSFRAISHIAVTALRRKKPDIDPGAQLVRHKAHILCSMVVQGKVLNCVIENLSLTGAAVRVPFGAALPGRVRLKLKTADGGNLIVLAAPVAKISEDGEYARYGMNFLSPKKVLPARLLGKKI